VLRQFGTIHYLDSLPLAQRLARNAAEEGLSPAVLVQVKLRSDPSKTGFDAEELRQCWPALQALQPLRLQGLMTMAPFSENPESARPVFEGLRKLRDALSTASGHPLKELSMGMSGDFEQGIAEGATIVRVGSAIFGARAAVTR
jgi:pyridoxal phosphate enzyme (YggS family)